MLDALQNLATPTVQDTALIITDQFQSFGIEGVNLSVCFSARRDYFFGVRSFAEPAVRFYKKCALEPFTLEETLEYTQAAFAGTHLESQNLAEWLFGKTLGHPHFLAFICRELWSHYRARTFTNATLIWPAAFRRLEQIKFTADLAPLSEKELALLQAMAADDQDEFNPAPSCSSSISILSVPPKQAYLSGRDEHDTGSTTHCSQSSCGKHNETQQPQKRKHSRRDAAASLAPHPGHCITHRAEAIPLTHSPIPIR